MDDIASTLYNDLKRTGNAPVNLFPDAPYISPSDGDIPVMAFHPVPYKLGEYVNSQPEKYAGVLWRVMSAVANCGCSAIITGGTFQQMDAQLKAVAELANGVGEISPIEPAGLGGGVVIGPPVTFGGPVLGVILDPSWLNESYEHCLRIIKTYRENKYVKGWLVFDQPNHRDWGDVLPTDTATEEYNRLTISYKTACDFSRYHVVNAQGQVDPEGTKVIAEQLTYFNLPASEIPYWIGGSKNYEEYLLALNTLFRPAVWSYNFFPFNNILGTDGTPTGVSTNHAAFYKFLELYSRNSYVFDDDITADTNSQTSPRKSPFWAYCQVEECKLTDVKTNKVVYWYPKPTPGMLRFEAFSALAFGAQGLCLSKLGMGNSRMIDSQNKLDYLSAPLDCTFTTDASGNVTANIKKSEVWEMIKTLTEEIKTCKEVFLGARCVSCGHIGKNYGLSAVIFPFGPVSRMKSLPGEGFLMTLLQNGSRKFVIVVNHDAFNSQVFYPELKALPQNGFRHITKAYANKDIKASADKEIFEGRETGTLTEINSENVTYGDSSYSIPPGGMLIFEYN